MAPNNSSDIHPATPPHMPLELVSEILARLPIGLLQRFRRVCKAWRDTISGDLSFARAHLHHQRRKDPWLLVAPEIKSKACDNRGRCSMYAGWYRWEKGQRDLVYAPDSPWLISKGELLHKFTHCDGLVLVPTETTVRVLNPATRRVLELPLNPCGVVPAELPGDFYLHQTFGLGLDPRSDTYKVVRLFCRSLDMLTMTSSLGVKVFTIGTDQHWREITAQPPYPAIAGWTATYCKGFLFWIIDYRRVHKDDDATMRGLVCFSLEDESFNVMATPMRIDSTCILAELHGELCVAHLGLNGQSLDMWICGDFVSGVNPPSWYRRDINVLMFPYQLGPSPLAAFREGGKFFECALIHDLICYDAQTWNSETWVQREDLPFQGHAKDKGTFIVERVFSFNVVPYIPSLVPI